MNNLKIRICALIFAGAWLFTSGSAGASGYGHSQCQRQTVLEVPFVETGIGGRAHLCVTRQGLKGKLWLRNVVEGNAYTVWWVYIDDGSACQSPFCFETFEPTDDDPESPAAVFGRMDSAVARRYGKLHFNDVLRDFKPGPGSKVQLLVFGHGPAIYNDLRRLSRQLLTPEDPCTGFPHLGIFRMGLSFEDCPGAGYGYPVASVVFETNWIDD